MAMAPCSLLDYACLQVTPLGAGYRDGTTAIWLFYGNPDIANRLVVHNYSLHSVTIVAIKFILIIFSSFIRFKENISNICSSNKIYYQNIFNDLMILIVS